MELFSLNDDTQKLLDTVADLIMGNCQLRNDFVQISTYFLVWHDHDITDINAVSDC
jgi:hypothetical protein